MDNPITKQNQFPIFTRPISAIPAGIPNGIFSQFLNTYPYLLNSSYFNPLNSNASSWLNMTNSSPNCPSPISPSNNASGRCPICYIPMQGIDANQHYMEELQKLENSRKKEAEEKCKSEIIDIEIENRNDDNGILQALVRRGSRFTGRYQTYLKIKQNREQRKMRSYRKKLISDDKNYNSIQSTNLSSFTPHQLNQLNQFSFSAAAAAQNNLLLHHQHQTQLLANQANQQHANNQTSFINGLLNSIAAASCNSPARSNNSNQTTCLDNVNETNLNLSNGLSNTNNSNNGNGNNTNSLGNSQSNDLSQDRISPGSTSSTPLTNLSSINGSANLLINGNNLNNTTNGNTNGNTTPTSTNTNSPITTLSSLNGSNNIVATLQNSKQSPIWSIASITGLNAVANNQNSLLLNGLQSLNNELKRRCLSDEEDEDLEITDDRDSIASNK